MGEPVILGMGDGMGEGGVRGRGQMVEVRLGERGEGSEY